MGVEELPKRSLVFAYYVTGHGFSHATRAVEYFNVNDDLLLALDKLNVVCFVKKYDSRIMGNLGTLGLRYSVVKTYAADTIKPVPDKTATTSTQETSASTDDPQIPTTTSKKFGTADNITTRRQAAHPRNSVKRDQSFISKNVYHKKHDMLHEAESSAQPYANDDDNVDKNPVKKARNKAK